MPYLAPLQITQGGPVLMMQVENEYGTFGNDKKYIKALRDMMREGGIDVTLFQSDGPADDIFRIQRWRTCFRRQTLAAEGRSHLTV